MTMLTERPSLDPGAVPATAAPPLSRDMAVVLPPEAGQPDAAALLAPHATEPNGIDPRLPPEAPMLMPAQDLGFARARPGRLRALFPPLRPAG